MRLVFNNLILRIFLIIVFVNFVAEGTLYSARALSVSADSSIVAALNSSPGVTVVQPDALTKRLIKGDVSKKEETETSRGASPAAKPQSAEDASSTQTPASATVYRPGMLRIEVFADNSSNAKSNATSRRRLMQTRFPDYPTALVFESPYWRVRVGAFSTRADAENALARMKSALPAYAPYMRIVSK